MIVVEIANSLSLRISPFTLQPSIATPRQFLPSIPFENRTDLPLGRGLLGSLGTPLGRGGGGTGGVPVAVAGLDGVTPLATGGGSTSETSRGGLPVTTGGSEAGLDGGNTLLLDAGELLLLDLVLGLGLGVAVWGGGEQMLVNLSVAGLEVTYRSTDQP